MATTRSMTLAEFAALPDEDGKQELIRGELVRMPPPKRPHGRIQKRIFLLLSAFADSHGCDVYVNTGFRLSEHSCVEPDAALVLPEQQGQSGEEDWFQGAPAIAVEILSPSNRAGETEDKVQAYLEAGAAAVWVVNPERRRVTAYSRGRFEIFEMPDGVLACPRFPELRIPVAAIFA